MGGCDWTATSNDSWITVTSGGSGSGNGAVQYSVAPNPLTTPRTGTLTVAGQTFTVNQSALVCTYSISPTSQSFPASGGADSVGVTAPGGCAWTAASNDTWIAVTSGGSGSGNGTVDYSVAANTAPAPRTGTLTIAGETFTVNQDPAGVPGLSFFTVSPCRVIDTRDPLLGGPALVAGTDRTFTITGSCALPATAKAVSVNLAVTAPTAAGNFRLYPAGSPLPLVSAINYSAGQTRANNGIISLSGSGQLTVRCAQASGTAHLILDVNGYFE